MTQDIFRWLHPVIGELYDAGEDRLAEGIDDFPSLVCEDAHDQVDAAYPELLAGAERLQHPWLQVFVRHWYLQSLIFRRQNPGRGLDLAVELVELASRPEAKDCPQSVCAVQDFCAGFGFADGPGHAEERIAITTETLERIDPSWPCWQCISIEHADALVHAGRAEDALRFLDRQELAARRAGGEGFEGKDGRVEALLQLDRAEEALSGLGEEPHPLHGRHGAIEHRLHQARCLARLGRLEEARDALPDFATDIAPTPGHHRAWVDAVAQLCARDGLPNDVGLDRKLAFITERLTDQRSVRDAFGVARTRFELALGRGALTTAEEALQAMSALLPELRQPLDAPEQIQSARDSLGQAPAIAPTLPDDPEGLEAGLDEDPERAWAQLLAARSVWPGHPRIGPLMHQLAYSARMRASALETLEEAAAAHPEDEQLHLRVGHLLLQEHPERLETWATATAALGPQGARIADWVLARREHAAGDIASAKQRLRRVVEDREAVQARMLLARLETDSGALPAAAVLLDEALQTMDAEDPRRRDVTWDRITLATRLGDWSTVRELSSRLGMEFEPGEGPIEEAWSTVRIRLEGEHGPQSLYALRTGPVTATVTSLFPPGRPPRFGTRVVFEPTPLEQEEGEPVLFAAIEVLEAGRATAIHLAGQRGSETELDDLEVKLRAHDLGLARIDEADFELPDGTPGFVWWLAATEDLEGLARTLASAAESWSGPLIWPELALALGDGAHQLELAVAWGLMESQQK